jgi:hypothetical protein
VDSQGTLPRKSTDRN